MADDTLKLGVLERPKRFVSWGMVAQQPKLGDSRDGHSGRGLVKGVRKSAESGTVAACKACRIRVNGDLERETLLPADSKQSHCECRRRQARRWGF